MTISAIRTFIFAAITSLPAPVFAQPSFFESFDVVGPSSLSGPSGLVARGWTFRNQSAPVGLQSWYQGPTPAVQAGWPNPQSGAGYVAVSDSYSSSSGGTVSDWAILPAIPNQGAGDELRFWVLGWSGNNTNTLQVRYSPTGAIGTGTGPSGVGNFTTLLLDMNPVPGPGWNLVSIMLPGSGRIALRSYIPSVCSFCFSSLTGVDSLSVGLPPPPPCNLPPVPTVGQAVVWTAAGSPYRMCENISIPSGSTVTVEPGVTVNFDADRTLSVAGTLRLQGSASQRIILNAAANFPPMITVDNGRIESTATDFRGGVRVNTGATVDLATSTFAGTNASFIVQELQAVTPFIRLTGCTFTNTYVAITDALSILEGNTFTGSTPLLLRGYADLTTTNTFIGCAVEVNRQRSIQPMLIDGVHASGSPGPGLILSGGTYHLGLNTVLTGNQFPLHLLGGLTRDSSLPLTGNTNNAVDVGNGGFMGEAIWPSLGLTYRLTQPGSSLPGGHLTIDPGVVVEAADPFASMRFRSRRYGTLLGMPGRPITFRGLGGQSWNGMHFITNADTGTRLEHCIVENAHFGASSSDNWLFADSCVFRNNQVGANMNSSGVISFAKTRFTANGTGIEFTDAGSPIINNPANPNSIAGNLVGVDAFEPLPLYEDLTNCWWGHPSGPTVASNPGGSGDSIIGIGTPAVLYSPFLTTAPNAANHPPVVRLVLPGLNHPSVTPDTANPDFLLEPGTKFIIRWSVSSDDAVIAQRIEFSPDGPYPDRYTIIADNIPPEARSWEITIPEPGFAVTNGQQFFRLIVTDAAGQTGFDHVPTSVPSGRITGDLVITTNLSGQTFLGGASIPTMQWTGAVGGFPTLIPMVVLESDGDTVMGIHTGGVGQFFEKCPLISTDRARLALMARGNSNDVKWFFAPGSFSIRHDPRLNLVPPTVALTAPTTGQSFPGGGTIPIAWTAAAPEGLRSFDIQASFDAGRSWHLVVRDLPGAARSYDWNLPPSTGIAQVRIRVIARDERFQNSSTIADPAVIIIPGSTQPCYANCDGSTGTPLLTANDFVCFINAYASGAAYANCDGSTGTPALTGNDFLCFLNRFAAGCP